MPAHRKYDSRPGPHNDEIPYDTERFKKWCIEKQGLSESTVKAYLGAIRIAFGVIFDDRDALFKNLRNAFLSMPAYRQKNIIEVGIDRLEDNYETLEAYIESIDDLYEDEVLNEFNSDLFPGNERMSNKAMWLTAFRTYCRYIRWNIDIYRINYGYCIYTFDLPEYFFELPFSREFKQYLRTIGNGYKEKSIMSNYCIIKRVYNLLIRHFFRPNVFEAMIVILSKGFSVQRCLDIVMGVINREIYNREFPELSLDNLNRSKTIFRQYIFFLKDYADNPGKYPLNVCGIRH